MGGGRPTLQCHRRTVDASGRVASALARGSVVLHASEVHWVDRTGTATLDKDAQPGSLRLHGSTLTWLHSGKRRFAVLK